MWFAARCAIMTGTPGPFRLTERGIVWSLRTRAGRSMTIVFGGQVPAPIQLQGLRNLLQRKSPFPIRKSTCLPEFLLCSMPISGVSMTKTWTLERPGRIMITTSRTVAGRWKTMREIGEGSTGLKLHLFPNRVLIPPCSTAMMMRIT